MAVETCRQFFANVGPEISCWSRPTPSRAMNISASSLHLVATQTTSGGISGFHAAALLTKTSAAGYDDEKGHYGWPPAQIAFKMELKKAACYSGLTSVKICSNMAPETGPCQFPCQVIAAWCRTSHRSQSLKTCIGSSKSFASVLLPLRQAHEQRTGAIQLRNGRG